MNNKLFFISDFDGTLADSDGAIRRMYANEFKCEIPPEITCWNGLDSLVLAPSGWIEKAFNSNELWQYMQLKDNVIPTLHLIKQSGYFDNMHICSIGRKNNIKQKLEFVDKVGLSEYFNDCLFMTTYSENVIMGKEFLNYNSALLDDHQKNLTNVRYPILFFDGKFKEWNKGYEGMAVDGWNIGLLDTLDAIVYNHEREVK